jgi:hypothetical protein
MSAVAQEGGQGVRWMGAAYWFFGLTNLANGLWMLFAPEHWFQNLPAGVPDTGPFNHHFVQDIGAAFTTIGVAFLVSAPKALERRGVLLAAALFYALHSIVHVADLLTGRLHAHHWGMDFPLVFLPTIVFIVLALPVWWPKERVG